MTVTQQDRDVAQGVFDAMQMGRDGEHKMLALFAENATMTEPFTGQPVTHEGKAAIRARFLDMWSNPDNADLQLTIDQIDAVDGKLRVEWNCKSEGFLTPMLGVDYFTISNGLIDDLTMEVVKWPEMAGGAHA